MLESGLLLWELIDPLASRASRTGGMVGGEDAVEWDIVVIDNDCSKYAFYKVVDGTGSKTRDKSPSTIYNGEERIDVGEVMILVLGIGLDLDLGLGKGKEKE